MPLDNNTRRYPRTLFGSEAAFPKSPESGHAVTGPFRLSWLDRLWIRFFGWL